MHSLIDRRVIDHKRFSSLLDNLLQEIMYYLVIFMQITEEQIELWTNNPSQFAEEDDQGFAYNVRISAQELLTVSTDKLATFARLRDELLSFNVFIKKNRPSGPRRAFRGDFDKCTVPSHFPAY